jgi:lipoprotein NlpI
MKPSPWRRLVGACTALCLGLCMGLLAPVGVHPAWAQVAPAGQAGAAPPKATSRPVPAKATPAKPAPAPAAAVAATGISGPGYRSGPVPGWVQPVPVPVPADTRGWAPTTGGARRELLVDIQHHWAGGKPQLYQRLRSVATESQALGGVSQLQIPFNPAFHTVVLHHATVWRNGRALDRLADARTELMRREQRLEQQVIDGVQTLLLLLSDVRVGEPVEVAYTVEGDNPIYEGRVGAGYQLAWDTPVDLLHLRIEASADRPLAANTLATDLQPERFTERGLQVLRVVRQQVLPVQQEQATPPWFKVYPALMVSDYRDWEEVRGWAQRLFALPAQPDPAVLAKAESLRATGKTGAALVDAALSFVQDEIRYFSVSLGESSHRPKPAARTLAERLGDCKDKVVLLNTLLQALGFDARPALVAMTRNRGLAHFLPSHEMFDHVVTRLVLDGQVRYLDGTLAGQGRTLAQRGHYPYGLALVVGEGPGLQPAMPPADAPNQLAFEQRWDLRQPGAPVRLELTVRARGLQAEGLRNTLAQGGAQRLAEGLGGAHARVLPGLQPVGAPEVQDDRDSNTVSLRQAFEHPDPGQYERGAIELEFAAIELLDVLVGPPETQRRTPFLIDQPLVVDSRIEVLPPMPLSFKPPAPLELANRHFRYTVRLEVQPERVVFDRRFERRADEVLPADLSAFREQLLRARQAAGGKLRLPLVQTAGLEAEFERIDRRVRSAPGARQDNLNNLLLRNEVARLFDTQALSRIRTGSLLAARVLAQRAIAHNLLGDFAAGLADADAALTALPEHEPALDARGVALVGLGRLDDALPAFEALARRGNRAAALNWLGSVQLVRGQPAAAEQVLREAVATGGDDDREFALLWLYLAAEQLGRGQAAIAPHVAAADPNKLTGALLHFFAGRIDQAALLKLAGQPAEMARLNLAEAWFFIGQQQLVRGQTDDALRSLRRVLDTGALPFREYTYALLLVARLAPR